MTDEFEHLVAQALAALPAPFAAAVQEVAINLADWPAHETLDALGIEDPLELTGLYEGIPLTEKSLLDQVVAPDVIWLFCEPILAEWRDRGNVKLGDLIAHVLVHELAHHFGWTDEEIARIDPWWE